MVAWQIQLPPRLALSLPFIKTNLYYYCHIIADIIVTKSTVARTATLLFHANEENNSFLMTVPLINCFICPVAIILLNALLFIFNDLIPNHIFNICHLDVSSIFLIHYFIANCYNNFSCIYICQSFSMEIRNFVAIFIDYQSSKHFDCCKFLLICILFVSNLDASCYLKVPN